MGHQINYLSFSGRYGEKRVLEECNRIHKKCCEYHTGLGGLRFPSYRLFTSYDEAKKFIEENDRGWYDQLAVKYKDKTKTMWLAKIEYHV